MHLELKGIHKYFGPVHANDNVNLVVDSGTIHGLLGENGAGKSTLMKVLSGFIHRDAGEILLDGQAVEFKSPAAALRAGVGMLHQDPLDFPPLRVLDNFLLGLEDGFMQNRAQALADLRKYSAQFGFDIDPESLVSALTVGERQQLEIMRLLSRGAKILIFDEPTTGISLPQKVKLFETLRLLAQEGMTVIFVTHKLEDAEDLCGQVNVLRRGQVVGHVTRPFTPQQLVQLMFGQQLGTSTRETIALGDLALELRDLAVADYRLRVPNINLQARCGEVIGLAGIEGSGQRLFLRAVAGLDHPLAGEIWIGGAKMNRQPYRRFLDRGVAYMPAGRLEEGLVPGLNLAEHFILAKRSKEFFINWNFAEQQAHERIQQYSIRGAPGSRVESLSGGNQQRALLALLRPDLNLLLLEHPTRGLDIESTLWVWNQLLERRRRGTTIIFASADLDEIFEYSDRILVFSGGRVAKALNAKDTSVAQLGELIGGKGL
ncbi:MAG: ATP-binding cassette domain-containing protein [Chloroflexi bacterium]|nr:ATP-binding cassette domain-containing protein [Chloroflexota bacterium]